MKQLRNRFERFCLKHRNWGIPNLMLYITLGSALVYLLSMINGGNVVYGALCFDKMLILQGQVWRLFTHVFAYTVGGSFFVLIALFCYYSLGRALENAWGTFRFNLFYFSGIVLMDIFAMIFGDAFYKSLYLDMPYYLNLSLLLAYATAHPDNQFVIFFVIPVKARILSIVYLVLISIDVFNLSYPYLHLPHNLFPLVALANYFLFFGKDVVNVIPLTWRTNAKRLFKKKKPGQKTGQIPFAGSYQAEHTTVKAPYTHRCTICGKTDISHPELEFRYCSRCNGYFCYCEEHISNHQHIE